MVSFSKGAILFIFLAGCSGMEQAEQEKLRRVNAQAELIYRNSQEFHYQIPTPKQVEREKYPWEMAYIGKYPKISKEYFRCKGSSLNPPHVDHKDPARPANYFDCGGFQKHSLPILGGKEHIYPILVDLLNYLQAKTNSKVVITCGHRCPVHNAYADSSTYNQNSKHMIGAEVDFYIQGMEHQPEKVIELIMGYYREMALYRGEKEYVQFQRLEQSNLNVSTAPWYNKEILIKLYKKGEGRDLDNRHPYPYLSIQVRYDRDLNEKVTCDWKKAFNGYRRY